MYVPTFSNNSITLMYFYLLFDNLQLKINLNVSMMMITTI